MKNFDLSHIKYTACFFWSSCSFMRDDVTDFISRGKGCKTPVVSTAPKLQDQHSELPACNNSASPSWPHPPQRKGEVQVLRERWTHTTCSVKSQLSVSSYRLHMHPASQPPPGDFQRPLDTGPPGSHPSTALRRSVGHGKRAFHNATRMSHSATNATQRR